MSHRRAAAAPREAPTEDVARALAGAPLGAVLRVIGAPAEPERMRLSEGSCVIGAGPTADIVIDDSAISRSHVELALVPEGVAVHDLKSRNGTFYLGQRVEKIVLTLGSRIRVGRAEIAIDPDLESLRAAPEPGEAGYRGLVGVSAAMRRLFAVLTRLEGSLVSVLVEGESGVGKELIARALHEGSSVRGGPYVVVNCATLGREMVLSELFGHKKGAFTGATEARRGAFEAAHGGTLFLDEIGELPLDVQPVLLRALESGEVKPLGGNEARTVRVRVVAATNRDLRDEMRSGGFREDLYYRLAVVKLEVPPLRKRIEDVKVLAQQFASAAGLGALPPEVIERFETQSWPGNARELRNAVQAYAALGSLPDAPRPELDALHAALRQLIDPARPYQEQKDELSMRFTRIYLEMLLAHTGGNQSEAARLSGLDRSYIGKLLAKHGIGKS